MLGAAGLEVVGSRLAHLNFGPPLEDDERQLAVGHLRHTREQLGDRLDEDDRRTLDVLSDVDDPRSIVHRPDLFVASTRQIIIARPDTAS